MSPQNHNRRDTLAKENLPPGIEATHVEMTGAEGVWVQRGNIDRLFSLINNETVKTLAKNTVDSDWSLGSWNSLPKVRPLSAL